MTQPSARPLREVVGDVLDDDAIERGLHAVQKRRRAARPASVRRRIAMLAAAAILVVTAIFLVLRVPEAGPLARTDGAPFDVVEAAAEVMSRAELTDGSRIEVEAGGRLVTVGNDGRRVLAVLERGIARVHVQPGGPRAWVFECGLATVEVVGTRFTLERSETTLRVDVTEGVVLVRGDNVPDRLRRLTAGEGIVVRAPGAERAATDFAPRPDAAAATSPAPRSSSGEPTAMGSAPATPRAPPPEGWRDLARRGAHRDAYAALGDGGVASASSSATVEDLFLLADVARLSGRPTEAVVPLQQIVQAHGGDGRAALAALTLGRLRLDQLGQPSHAAADLEVALAMGLPGALQEDALGRVVEARSRAGDGDGARRAAERYLARYPGGRHAAMAQAQLDGGP